MSTMTTAPVPKTASSGAVHDFDLHGLVGIRLLGAGPKDVAAVRRQLGPIDAALDREPDVTIRFVDRLETRGKLRLLGVNDTGFTDDAFLVLRAKQKTPARVAIPFDRIGERLEIVCERGLPAVPLLVPIVNVTALARGALPLHASAVTWEGTGLLFTGWAKGGKTESLLSFIDRGATYVGDEWVYLSEDGDRMHGIPEPIRIWDWHLSELPRFRKRVGAGDRARLGALRAAVGAMERFVAVAGGTAPGRLLRRALPIVRRQLWVQMPPELLFAGEATAMARPDKIFLVASHERPDIEISPIETEEVARRMVFSLLEERADLLSCYWSFRFAFPDRRNDFLESVEDIQRTALRRVLDGKEAYLVEHPYPVSIPALYRHMAPFAKGKDG